MGDLTSFIMSLDTNQAIPIGLASLLGVGLITYFLLKPKNKNKILSSEDGEIKIISNDLNDVPIEKSDNDSIFNEILEDSKASRLDETTLTKFDSHFNNEPSLDNNTAFSESESLLKQLASESDKIDQERTTQSQLDSSNFEQAFANLNLQRAVPNSNQERNLNANVSNNSQQGLVEQFGSLASTIQEEKQQSNNTKDCFDVWVNYMGIKQGKMLLLNTFIHLSNPWGSISAINELSSHIEKEIEADPNSGKKSWAIISVTEITR